MTQSFQKIPFHFLLSRWITLSWRLAISKSWVTVIIVVLNSVFILKSKVTILSRFSLSRDAVGSSAKMIWGLFSANKVRNNFCFEYIFSRILRYSFRMKSTNSVSRPYQNRTNSVSDPYQVQAYRHEAGMKLMQIRQRADKTLIMSACKEE